MPRFGDGSELAINVPKRPEIFVAYPWDIHENRAAYKKAYRTLEGPLACRFVFAEDRVTSGHILDKIIAMIKDSVFGIYDITTWNANVTLEYGVARGLGAPAFLVFNPDHAGDVPSDVRGYDRSEYRSLGELSEKLIDLAAPQLGLDAGKVRWRPALTANRTSASRIASAPANARPRSTKPNGRDGSA